MKSQVSLIEINSIFSSWNTQIDLIKCSYRITCKLSNLSFLYNLFLKLLGKLVAFFYIILIFTSSFDLHLLLLFGALDMEPDFANIVVIFNIISGGLDYDVIFVDSGIIDLFEVDVHDFMILAKCCK